MGNHNLTRKAFDINSKAVILRSNVNFPSLQILDRMVGTPVAELELVGVSTKGEGKDLVAEADAIKGTFPISPLAVSTLYQAALGSPGPLEKTTPWGR